MTTLAVVFAVWRAITPSYGEDLPQKNFAADAAFEQNKRLGRGINILGYDPIWKSDADARFRKEYFNRIHDAGFNHVRINLHPFRDADADGRLGEQYWKTLDWAVRNALQNHLAVVLDFHEFLEMAKNPVGRKKQFLDIWRQIAERYQNAPDTVYFELLNEPHGRMTPALWNGLLREALDVVRRTNPNRPVIIGPGHWNNIDYLDDLDLPKDDRNIIVTVHFYDPFPFTHQGTPWTEHKDTSGVVWNGNEKERDALARRFARAQAWAKERGRPIYLGEFGAYDTADMPSRERYMNAVAREAEKNGWSWACWQFDSDFILFDVPNDRWIQPLLDALIGQTQNFHANPP